MSLSSHCQYFVLLLCIFLLEILAGVLAYIYYQQVSYLFFHSSFAVCLCLSLSCFVFFVVEWGTEGEFEGDHGSEIPSAWAGACDEGCGQTTAGGGTTLFLLKCIYYLLFTCVLGIDNSEVKSRKLRCLFSKILYWEYAVGHCSHEVQLREVEIRCSSHDLTQNTNGASIWRNPSLLWCFTRPRPIIYFIIEIEVHTYNKNGYNLKKIKKWGRGTKTHHRQEVIVSVTRIVQL